MKPWWTLFGGVAKCDRSASPQLGIALLTHQAGHPGGAVMLPSSSLAIGAFAILVVGAVLAICGNDQPGRGWGWSALLLLTAIALLIVVQLAGVSA